MSTHQPRERASTSTSGARERGQSSHGRAGDRGEVHVRHDGRGTARAAVTADEIAEYAEFLSFGTNDLTQTTFAMSRDDAESSFLMRYLRRRNPTGEPVCDSRCRRCRETDELSGDRRAQDPTGHRSRRLRRARRRPHVDFDMSSVRSGLRQLLSVPSSRRPPGSGTGRSSVGNRGTVTGATPTTSWERTIASNRFSWRRQISRLVFRARVFQTETVLNPWSS